MRIHWAILLATCTLLGGIAIGALAADLAGDDTIGARDEPTQREPHSDGSFALVVNDGDVESAGAAGTVIETADLDGLVAWLDETVVLDDTITMYIEDDPGEAYYDEGAGEITISPAFIDSLLLDIEPLYDSPDDAVVAAASNLTFIALHEVAHALIDRLELPITGREEVAADEFAVVTMVTLLDDPVAALEASDLFDVLARQPSEADYYGEHNLDQQRFFDMRCLVYGFAPDEFADELEGLPIDEYRADLCIDDAERAATSWDALMEDHLA